MKQLMRMWRPLTGELKLQCHPRFRTHTPRDPTQRPTPMQSMREFFMHPLTWDRNNGYFNVVLALTLFGFVFFNSCDPCDQKKRLEDRKVITSDITGLHPDDSP